MLTRLIKVGDATSQMFNVALFNGHPNESMSGRAWRTQSKWHKVIDAIFFFDQNHCKVAFENDIAYAKELVKFYSDRR